MAANTYVGRVRKGAAVADTGARASTSSRRRAAADEVLRVEHVAKRFGPVTALRDVNLHLRKGEVLGLLGDNGAGKSTLVKIICGFQKPDAGRIFLGGEPVRSRTASTTPARSASTPSTRTSRWSTSCRVFHNMFLRRERVRSPLPFLANRVDAPEAREALDDIGVNIPRLNVPVARLSGGQRQAIAVARDGALRGATSCCSTSRSRRWAPRRARSSST